MNLIDRDELLKQLNDIGTVIDNRGRFIDNLMLYEILDIVESQKRIRPPQEIKPLANSTLRHMTKSEMIEYIRMCEHNTMNAYAQNEQQVQNIEKLLKEKNDIIKTLEKFCEEKTRACKEERE